MIIHRPHTRSAGRGNPAPLDPIRLAGCGREPSMTKRNNCTGKRRDFANQWTFGEIGRPSVTRCGFNRWMPLPMAYQNAKSHRAAPTLLDIELERKTWFRLYRCSNQNVANGIGKSYRHRTSIVEEARVEIDLCKRQHIGHHRLNVCVASTNRHLQRIGCIGSHVRVQSRHVSRCPEEAGSGSVSV